MNDQSLRGFDEKLLRTLRSPNTTGEKSPEYCRHHFIHIPDSGGTSVRVALERLGDVSMGKRFHSLYCDVVGQFGRHVHSFRVVRNPWNRTSSS